MKKMYTSILIAGLALASIASPVFADDTAQPVPPPQAAAAPPQANLAPAYLIVPTHPSDTTIPFSDPAKCDAAAKAIRQAYKAACVHTQ